MKTRLLATVVLSLLLPLAARLSAQSVTFTNDTAIQPFNTNYDGAEIVVTNCTLTVDGYHAFSNVLVAAGGTLTHSFSSDGTILTGRSITDEPHTLNDTNAVTLLGAGQFFGMAVMDVGKTVVYTNDQDYVISFPGNGFIQLQRTTNSTIPDGATVLVNYTVIASTPTGLNLSVTGSVEIAVGGAINTDGRGYGGNVGPGNGGESLISPFTGAGAGYGGYGGMSSSNAPGGTSYGSFTQPIDLGSGGGYGAAGSGAAGGAGGGAIKLIAGGDVIINGTLSANGANAINSRSGGGSGGSVWLSGQTLSGAGAITANGAAGEPIHGGGGGGGRIALQMDTNNFTGQLTAYGGVGAKNGGAGTIYTKPTLQNGSLLVDNGGLPGTNTLLQVPSDTDVTVRGRAVATFASAQSLGTLLVGSNSVITFPAPYFTAVNITCSGDLLVEPGARILADGGGSTFGSGSGASFSAGSGIYYGGGGGHGGAGGMGGNSNARGGGAFDSTIFPSSVGGPGAGSGSSFSPFGGLGGGSVRLSVNGKLILNGGISADGKAGSGAYAGGGAGGSIWCTLGTWTGAGTVSANGGAGVLPGGGGGGGGRISISFNSNAFTGTITAYGGTGTNAGGAGTVYLKTNSQSTAQLILDNGGVAGTNTTIDTSSTVDATISGKALLQLATTSWFVRNLQIRSNSTVTGNTGTSPSTFTVFAIGTVAIDAGGALTMDGLGYAPGQGNGPGYQSLSSPKGGGGHGGYGGANPAIANFGNAYDSIVGPSIAGSGGGSGSGSTVPPLGGNGGGVLGLNVTGALTVNGRISANGRDGDLNSGGGSGGSLSISCAQLSGAGIISANGGAGNGNAGGGGGGRIAVTFTSNGFTGMLTASGGNGLVAGGAGTIYTKFSTSPRAELIVNNGGLIGTNTPLSSSFALPSSLPFNLTITGGAAVVPLTPLPLLSYLTITANSALTSLSNQTSLAVTVIKNVSIAAGGAISVDGKGFGRAAGPGPGTSVSSKGSGGGYGAIGGASASGAIGGTNYGSATQPVDRGSGGGAGANAFFGGSDGGGAIRLIVGGTLAVNGSLSANGSPGLQDDSGGGAGGSIWVTTESLSGNGFISANGGQGELFGGGGGAGGRIAIYSRSNTFAGAMSVAGGIGATTGGDGSLLLSANLPSIRGTVTDTNGLPVTGVVLVASIGNVSTTTAADGTYQLSLVPYTSFNVTPSFSGFVFVPGSRSYSTTLTSISNQNYLMIDTIVPTMTGSLQNANLVVNWFGVAGVSYQLYSSTNLVDWLPFGSPVPGIGAPLEVLVPVNTDPRMFFRVQASN